MSTAPATASGRQRLGAATNSPANAARTKSEPSFFASRAPAKQSAATASAQRSFVRSQRPAAAAPMAKISVSGMSAYAVSRAQSRAGFPT